MAKRGTSFDMGRGAYWQGKLRKPTNDGAFMQTLQELNDLRGDRPREEKRERIEEWKDGWDDAHKEDLKNKE